VPYSTKGRASLVIEAYAEGDAQAEEDGTGTVAETTVADAV